MPLKNILLVDDDPIAVTLNKLLLQHMDVSDKIAICNNGEEALSFLKQECFSEEAASNSNPLNLMFLDVNMPVMSGYELLQELENFKKEGCKLPKVVLLSASDHPRNLSMLNEFEIFDYMVKPLTEDKIFELIEKLKQ